MPSPLIIVFLLIIFTVGWITSQNVISFRDYSTGSGEFSIFTLVASTVGAWISTNIFIGGMEYMCQEGWAQIIATMTMGLSYFINGWFIIPRLAKYADTLSLGCVLGRMYGPTVQILAAISMLIYDICRLVIEYIILQKVLQVFLGIDHIISLMIVIMMTTIYTVQGGLMSVIITNVIQYMIFIIGLPMILYYLWDENTYSNLRTIHEYKNLNFSEYFAFNSDEFKLERFNTMMSLIFITVFPCMTASRFQRFLASKDPQKAKWVFIYSGIVISFIFVIIALINIIILLKYPDIIHHDVISNVITIMYNTGCGACIVIVILSMSMSTISSIINSTSIVWVNDIMHLLRIPHGHTSVHRAKIFGFITSIISALIVIIGFKKNLIGLFLMEFLYIGYQCYIAAVLIPMLLYIYDYRFTQRGAEMGIILSLILVVILQILRVNEVYGFVMLLIITPILMYIGDYIVVSYMQNSRQN